MVPSLLPDNIINLDNLPPDHPLIRPIESIELKMAINFSKPNKAPGPSSVTVLQLKHLPVNFMKAIRNLYDAMLASKYLPNILLKINMLFFGKHNNDLTDPTNYRPISLLETICKTLERIITNRFVYFLEHHNLLSEFQFGFRKQRSTQHVITLACETIKENSRQQIASLAATRDISKAFDTIWHAGLIYKLQLITNGCTHFTAFIHYYLTNRIITPIFNGKKGNPFNPKAGVPQGSVIGPLLFNIYVNDMPSTIHKDTIRPQFADDVLTIVRSDFKRGSKYKYENVLKKLQDELNRILKWERDWKIKVNPHKSMVGCSSAAIPLLELLGGININGAPVRITNTIKILGHNFNLNYFFTSQVTTVTQKARNNISRLYRFRSAPIKIKRHLYLALIRPLLEYPSSQLNNCNITNTKKIQRIQNKGTRFICDVRLNDRFSSRDLHTRLNLKPMNVRISKLSHKLMYKMHETYCTDDDILSCHINCFSDFVIDDQPNTEKSQSLANLIIANIYNDPTQCPWYNPPDIHEWTSPQPVFA